MIVPTDPLHETPHRDIEMQEWGQEDGTIPPVLSSFLSAEEDHNQLGEEGAVDAHGEPNGINGHVEGEGMKMEEVEHSDADEVSAMSVCDFCRAAPFVLCRSSCANQLYLLCFTRVLPLLLL